jgi:hypothetical protein
VFFVNSEFGIFNLLVAFFVLFNTPVTVPTAFGLVFRHVPKWSGAAAMTWGLVTGVVTRYILGWEIGPQVYLAFLMTFGVFVTSHWTGRLYEKNRAVLAVISLSMAFLLSWLFTSAAVTDLTMVQQVAGIIAGAGMGLSLFGFARLFASQTAEERQVLDEFFRKLDTPIDVAKEVFGAGKKQVSTFPLVGATVIGMGLLMSLIFLMDLTGAEESILGMIITLLVCIGGAMWYFGKRSEIRDANQYSLK